MDFDPDLQQEQQPEQEQAAAAHWLTSEQVDEIVANASADDIVEAMAAYPDIAQHPLEISREIFNRSAARLGMTNGATAAQMVPARHWKQWTQQLRRLIGDDASPLPEASDLSLISADIGE